MEESEIHHCKNCGNTFTGAYCNQCGQKVIARFNLKYLWIMFHEEFLEIDRGFWHTLKDLTLKPGAAIKDYLNGNTKKYFSPVKYLLICTAVIYFLLTLDRIIRPSQSTTLSEFDSWKAKFFSHEHPPFSFGVFEELMNAFFFVIKDYLAAYFLIMLPFVAFAGQFVFRKLNFTELLITWIYLWAHVMCLFLILSFPLTWIIGDNLPNAGLTIMIVILMILMFYFFTSVFRALTESRWIISFLKLILSMYGGFFVFYGVTWVILSFVKLVYQK